MSCNCEGRTYESPVCCSEIFKYRTHYVIIYRRMSYCNYKLPSIITNFLLDSNGKNDGNMFSSYNGLDASRQHIY
jgi:hypothetical protein